MESITTDDRKDMQGLLVYAYAQLRAAYFVYFKIENARAFKQWLNVTSFHNAEKSPKDSCLNIAFTNHGLKQLVDNADDISKENGFDQAFVEGIDTDYRNRILGDYDHNDPSRWTWGNRSDIETHGVLMIYATNEELLDHIYNQLHSKSNGSLKELRKTKCTRLNNDKEHFGFTDGISQPVLKGLARNSQKGNYINPGEIILGHNNAYGKTPVSPTINKSDFGRNSSYMVIRDMQQDVKLFWKTMVGYGGNPILTASKMIGRWPNGIPLELAQTEAEATKLKAEKSKLSAGELNTFLNEFEYFKEDSNGLKCPIGAHIRRGNPKDSKNESETNPNEVSNKHRILRRGKSYGQPFVESIDPNDIIAVLDKEDTEERGLNFVCFNSDIKRQFEFIQQTWMNNTNFIGLYEEVDPLIGVQGKLNKTTGKMDMLPTNFTEPACPFRYKRTGIPPFVRVKAAGYFFFPSIKAINILAS
jgi:Dyp-type peroxidase family